MGGRGGENSEAAAARHQLLDLDERVHLHAHVQTELAGVSVFMDRPPRPVMLGGQDVFEPGDLGERGWLADRPL